LPDFYVGKCDSTGAIRWLRQIGAVHQQRGVALVLDQFNNSYVLGSSANAIPETSLSFGAVTLSNVMAFVAKYDSAGNPLWGKSVTATGGGTPWGIAVAAPVAVYVAGGFSYSLPLGNFTLAEGETYGSRAMFIAKLAGLEVPAAPQITGQPQSQTVPGGAK